MEIGKNFYQYQIQSLLTENTIARNWSAKHHSLGRNVRIKQMKNSLLQTEQQKLQLRTIATQNALLQHSHIQLLYDYLENSHGIFFVYEQIDGISLEKFLMQKPSEQVRKEVFVQILDALAYSHRKGVLHLFLNPQNIFVSAQNQVTISDFGFGQFLPMQDNAFVAPEQLQNGYTDARTDIYAAGKILGYLFPNPPENLQKIIKKACEPDAYKRYQTCEAMKADFLQEFFVMTHQEAPTTTIGKLMPFVWGGVGLVVLLGTFFFLRNIIKTADKKPKVVTFDSGKPAVIKDTTDYTKIAKQKEEEKKKEENEEEKDPKKRKKDSLDKIKKERKEARAKREKERKELALKKVIVDGQFVSNQLGEYKINVEIFNSNKDLELQEVVLMVSYFNTAGEVIEKEEKTLPRLAANEATAVEIIKKVNAARFSCKIKDAKLPPDPNEPLEEDLEE
jgi:serine/threonine protein kinase